ncbi:MAG TPA: NADH-quinone oxidoreductase subunit N, partial [Candidatus Binatia bacterium]|nr:NADH-quinone oxidoreductase subunit N [Candidatus Binatia bacterium]
MDLNNLESLSFSGPELILTGTIILLIVLDLFIRNKRNLAVVAIIGCVASLLSAFDLYTAPQGWLFHRMVVLDNFCLFFKIVTLLAAICAIWMSLGSAEIKQVYQGEYYTLLLTCALGIFFMASSSNLLTAYLSLELVSLTSYVLTGFLP